MEFFERLYERTRGTRLGLCVGLDPAPARLPAWAHRHPDPALAFLRWIIEATAEVAAAYKPNLAFYLALGPSGLETLRAVRAAIPPEIPVILDGKFGDIGWTAEAYAQFAFEVLRADAVTLNPFLGPETLRPFRSREGRGIFLLIRTSNPGAEAVQELPVQGEAFYLALARRVLSWPGGGGVGFVVGATVPHALAALRRLAPDRWFLIPGIGPQGGDPATAVALAGPPALIAASREILEAPDPGAAARSLLERMQEAAGGQGRPSAAAARALARWLFETGCIRFGEFLLKSGQRSPIYLDLRRLVTFPRTLEAVANLYAALLEGLVFDRLAALPYAALPIGTAVALQTGRPLIYPRKEAKAYGTAQRIEGDFHPGETVVVLDDVLTTGASKREAIQILEEAGLRVTDIVVLVDREQGGREELEAAGYRVHAVITLTDLLETLAAEGWISPETRDRVRAELAGGAR
ncbi:orotidine-5'-phosphate decarboxylase [Thermoflexus sp.]|uniref:orotidine-5'-phosphate decarboxylase n=1 Tax=Thermoflexus sp. TaxID=1969742 RepID=UPI0026363302|nr:orotidine-5'-phosphate decarboxylase [Thermoflexus sp.]MCX7691525.1 orotidine-5'-phosphate decarboxylase [Thermoflexus sp.]